MTQERAPYIEGDQIVFSFPDPHHDLEMVRLYQEVVRPRQGPEFTYVEERGAWQLHFPVPDADRIEYAVELKHRDGGWEMICDPTNERRSVGVFGDKSVFEMPGYSEPQWLSKTVASPGNHRRLDVRSRTLRTTLGCTIWSPADTADDEQLPILFAHDGPEYDQLSSLTHCLAVAIEEGRLPRLRAALIPPHDRNQTYSASAAYSRAFAHEILPAVTAAAPVPHGRSQRVGMGASLGALAMLHIHRRSPATFGGLFLQSGSYFRLRFDKHESHFSRFRRISRFVGELLASEEWAHPIDLTLTCGTIEENLHNNRAVHEALLRHGYDSRLVVNRDGHNYTGWRDTFDPHLIDLLARLWT
jgi:enterochelin esterase-like enzyme